MNESLLPSNATPLEHTLASLTLRPRLDALADQLAGIKHRRDDVLLPWLASEWGLTPFAPYFPDARHLIEAGLPWLLDRGSAAAVLRALSWIALKATLEENGARLQLDSGRLLDLTQLPAIIHLVEASIPAHVRFERLYHGWDQHRLIASHRRSALSQSLISEDSGVVIDGLKVSFGARRHGALAGVPAVIHGVVEALLTGHLIVSRWPRYGLYRLSQSWPWRASGVRGALMTGGTRIPAGVLSASSRPRRIPRAALVAGEPLALGTLNSRLSGMPPWCWPTRHWVLSEAVLSGEKQQWQCAQRHEVFSERRSGDGAIPLALTVIASQSLTHIGHAPRRPAAPQHRWTGAWDRRRWHKPAAGSGTFISLAEESSP